MLPIYLASIYHLFTVVTLVISVLIYCSTLEVCPIFIFT